MAIIIRGKTACSICGEVLEDGTNIVATPAFIQLQSDPLWRYSDSAMHRACFARWPQAAAFRDAFNSVWSLTPKHPRQMLEDGTIVRGAAATRKAAKPRSSIAVLGVTEERTELLDALTTIDARHSPLSTEEPVGSIREYVAGIVGPGDSHQRTVRVGARSLNEARSILDEAFGPANVFGIYNKEDAQRPRS